MNQRERSALVERLRAGKAAREVELVPWHCRRGHVQQQRADALAVYCGQCQRDPAYHRSAECRRVDLYPNWARDLERIDR